MSLRPTCVRLHPRCTVCRFGVNVASLNLVPLLDMVGLIAIPKASGITPESLTLTAASVAPAVGVALAVLDTDVVVGDIITPVDTHAVDVLGVAVAVGEPTVEHGFRPPVHGRMGLGIQVSQATEISGSTVPLLLRQPLSTTLHPSLRAMPQQAITPSPVR